MTDSLRQLAVDRRIDPARERAEERVQAFLDAALEVLTSDSPEFTLQEVVERSGQSLRSFYQHFGSKDELLLVLFEEGIRNNTAHLAEVVEDVDDPLERLRTFVVEYHRGCRAWLPSSMERPPTRAIGQFAHRLQVERPDDATRAFAPLTALLRRLLDEAAAAGAIRPVEDDELPGTILAVIMFNGFAPVIAGTPLVDEASTDRLWQLLSRGLAP